MPRLSQNLSRKAIAADYLPQGLPSRILQYSYIAENPNPTGQKHLLDAPSDGSTYSQVHQRYHPIIRNFLERFGYYDIFLVDDETGSIGKRYRRQDEAGTPYCLTIDGQTKEDNTVTVRERDSMEQTRINIDQVKAYLREKLDL